jgi:hypothetical protein
MHYILMSLRHNFYGIYVLVLRVSIRYDPRQELIQN